MTDWTETELSALRRAYGIRRADDLAAVVAFFEARNGRLHGFRFKDWGDHKSCLPSGRGHAFVAICSNCGGLQKFGRFRTANGLKAQSGLL